MYTKLRVKSFSDPTLKNVPIGETSQIGNEIDQKTMDYVGNMIYENGKLKMILTDNGYYDCGNDDKKYYFYIKDHLGNNRVVADADGSLIQSTQYYPFGLAYGDGIGSDKQPFKYNGKELDSDHELNMYDYSARYYEPAVGRFTSVDPLAEEYYSISPYVYCFNNPIKHIDPDGKQGLIPFLLGTNNPVLPMGRNVSMLSTADKIVRVGSRTATESKLNPARLQSGRNVETEQLQKLGLEKNTESFTRIDPKTGKEGTTIPDAIKDGQTVEVKNVKQQGMSKQLRLQEKVSKENGKKTNSSYK